MENARKCSQCGEPLAAGAAPEGLCPRCLLDQSKDSTRVLPDSGDARKDNSPAGDFGLGFLWPCAFFLFLFGWFLTAVLANFGAIGFAVGIVAMTLFDYGVFRGVLLHSPHLQRSYETVSNARKLFNHMIFFALFGLSSVLLLTVGEDSLEWISTTSLVSGGAVSSAARSVEQRESELVQGLKAFEGKGGELRMGRPVVEMPPHHDGNIISLVLRTLFGCLLAAWGMEAMVGSAKTDEWRRELLRAGWLIASTALLSLFVLHFLIGLDVDAVCLRSHCGAQVQQVVKSAEGWAREHGCNLHQKIRRSLERTRNGAKVGSVYLLTFRTPLFYDGLCLPLSANGGPNMIIDVLCAGPDDGAESAVEVRGVIADRRIFEKETLEAALTDMLSAMGAAKASSGR